MKHISQTAQDFLHDDDGSVMAEYGVLIAGVAIAGIAVIAAFMGGITSMFTRLTTALNDVGS